MALELQPETFERRVVGRAVNGDTFKAYRRWAERFITWAEDLGYTDVTEGTLIEFDEALTDPPEPGVEHREEPYAYRTRVKALSGVKRWAETVLDAEISTDVNELAKGEPAEFDPYIYPPEEVERVLTEDCDVTGCLAARRLSYDAILRAAEVTRVRPKDLDHDEQSVYVRAVKGSENRHVVVDDETWELLEAQLQRVQDRFSDPSRLFYDSTDQNAWSPNGWSEHFRRNHAPDVPGEDTGSHSFARHTRITRMLQEGHDFGDVYLRARHSNPQMTSRYSNVAGIEADSDLFGADG